MDRHSESQHVQIRDPQILQSIGVCITKLSEARGKLQGVEHLGNDARKGMELLGEVESKLRAMRGDSTPPDHITGLQ